MASSPISHGVIALTAIRSPIQSTLPFIDPTIFSRVGIGTTCATGLPRFVITSGW
ncbi:MAG: hypothetical protein ABSF53_20925 [Terracidiphilus sp.]|jgi:hypothetical protein